MTDTTSSTIHDLSSLSPLADLLVCLRCGANVAVEYLSPTPGYPELGPDGGLACLNCGQRYPIIAGTPRMLPGGLQRSLRSDYPLADCTFPDDESTVMQLLRPADATREMGDLAVKKRTADSFTYEWQHFGKLREQWRKNFLDYMQPHRAGRFRDLLVLDVGAGSGRHSRQAAELGARVVAVDLGRTIDVARANLPSSVLTVQADADWLPLTAGAFDFVMSIGVLHHLPDPARALRGLVRLSKPGGHLHVYLYWIPERPSHARILRSVTQLRRITTRLPHRLLHAVCVPLGLALMLVVVFPYRVLRPYPRLQRLADLFPLKTYADYPVAVIVNDQFDRLSAPLERRFTRDQVSAMFEELGLEDVHVIANHGWIADGRVREGPPT